MSRAQPSRSSNEQVCLDIPPLGFLLWSQCAYFSRAHLSKLPAEIEASLQIAQMALRTHSTTYAKHEYSPQ